MGTKENPGKYDCYEKAKKDEPMFVLLARDPLAPTLVRLWVAMSQRPELMINLSVNRNHHPIDPKEQEAWRCAGAMEQWRKEHPTTPEELSMAKWTEVDVPDIAAPEELFVWIPPSEDSHKRTLACVRDPTDGRLFVLVRDQDEITVQAWLIQR